MGELYSKLYLRCFDEKWASLVHFLSVPMLMITSGIFAAKLKP